MLIVTLLRSKGDAVVTVPPNATVRELLGTLAEHRIGAVVVSSGAGIAGIVSERDVVRHLHASGEAVLERNVGSIMTTAVVTCRVSCERRSPAANSPGIDVCIIPSVTT